MNDKNLNCPDQVGQLHECNPNWGILMCSPNTANAIFLFILCVEVYWKFIVKQRFELENGGFSPRRYWEYFFKLSHIGGTKENDFPQGLS